MESMPRQVGGEVFRVAAAPEPVAPRVRIERRAVPRDTAAHVRMNLQHRAAINLQNHVLRAVRRFTVLVLADIASFGVMRALLRAVREHAVLGASIADSVARMLPGGMFNGWQYAAALFVALFVTGNYGRGDQRRDQRRLFFACAVATALPLWMTLWTRGLEPVLLQYGLTTVLVWFGLVAERRVIDGVVNWVRPVYRNAAATLFVGPADECREAIESPAFAVGGECRAVGFVDVHIPPANDALGHIADFPKVLQRAGAEVVVVCGYLTDAQFREVVDAALAAECQVLSVPRAIEVAGVQPNLVWRHEQPVVELTAPSLKGWQLILKRVLDLAGASIGLIILSPVFAVVAGLVRLGSPGPVFFTQARVGRGGRRFRIIKFRTMVNGAENHRADLLSRSVYPDARLFKVPDDPRITPLGRWLRRTSIDELPQLVNVLRGQMSLVGPRPPLPSEVALYEEHHYARFDVKPGITGPWQVAGRNGVTSFEHVMALETNYIRNWSVWADLRLLVKTVPAVVRMQGAF